MRERNIPGRLGYQPALDGLRAVAVLAVVIYHDRLPALLRGGFLGVDVFFVLSGFLITGILLADHARRGSTISVQFWIRRIRRLLPAFLVMMLVIAALAAFAGDPSQNDHVRREGLLALVYLKNWQEIYWSNFIPTPFSHTWSLSIEEQWYLIWPFLLGGLMVITRGRRARLGCAIATLGVASAALMWWTATNISRTRAFFGTDTRAWELLAGAVLAVMITGRPASTAPTRSGKWWEVGGVLGLGYLGWAFATLGERDRHLYPGARLLLVFAVVLVIAASIRPESPILRPVLGFRPFVAIGLISYGLYLFHIPIFGWLTEDRVGFGGNPLFAIRLVVLFALATASYRFVEMPIRRGARLPISNGLLLTGAVVTVSALFVVATLRTGVADQAALALNRYKELAATTPSGTDRVLLVGDETAFQAGWQIKLPFEEGGIRGTVAATVGCGIVAGIPVSGDQPLPHPRCRPWQDVFREARDAFDPAVSVLMIGDAEVFDRVVDGKTLRVGTPEAARYLRHQLESARRILSADDRPLIVTTVPCTDVAAANGPTWAAIRNDPARAAAVNRTLRQFAKAHQRSVHLADLNAVLCPLGNPHAAIGTFPLRPNGVTVSPTGSRVVWRWLAPIARRLANT